MPVSEDALLQLRQDFAAAAARLEGLGGTAVELDFEPFLETARLLYGGPWVAERYHAIRDFIERQPESVFPVTRAITLGGATASAVEAFDAQYRLRALKRRCDAAWQQVDLILTPTAGHQVCGFICESGGLDGAEDITRYGGWKAWLAR